LSSGLDILRKTLGQHEIATVQTTAIDQSAGTVIFTDVQNLLGPYRGAKWRGAPKH
jgi:hypothetical protein